MNNFLANQFCECKECRSLLSPAAYFVDLLKFLDNSKKNADSISPLDVLLNRRPDLEHIPLSCENTNTIIPYIDLVNEIMEFYVANSNKLTKEAAHDTGDATAGELRANPQYTIEDAYGIIKDAVYPFSLPYHQPLDVMRTYLEHLQTSRSEIMETCLPGKWEDIIAAIEIACEYLLVSEEEFKTLTGKNFGGNDAGIKIWEYYGYSGPTGEADFKKSIFKVSDFISRNGIKYSDLIEIVKTQFINPGQLLLDYLQDRFSASGISANELYAKLKDIKTTGVIAAQGNDTRLPDVLNANNISSGEFIQWVKSNFENFGKIVTLYQPESKCDLVTTELKTLKDIYEDPDTGLGEDLFPKFHRFVRLWHRSGWTVHELDNMMTALSEEDITSSLVIHISFATRIKKELKLSVLQLACFWGNIDSYGEKSVYEKLFLNKALQKIDKFFTADKFGNYLSDTKELLNKHITAILAAFRITEEQLDLILSYEKIDKEKAVLTIENLSRIYRYALLAKSLNLKPEELCKQITIFGINPFSRWDDVQLKFTGIEPVKTLEFIRYAMYVQSAGFKTTPLHYIINGTSDAASKNLEISQEKLFTTIKSIRDSLLQIESTHPDSELPGANEDLLRKKVALLFTGDVTEQLVATLNGKIMYSIVIDKKTNIEIPDLLKGRIKILTTRIEGKEEKRLQCEGIMSEDDRKNLSGIPAATDDFKTAVEKIYSKPVDFIKNNFSVIYAGTTINIDESIFKLLDRQKVPAKNLNINEKCLEFYTPYLTYLKKQLRKKTINDNMAILLGLDENLTATLINDKSEQIAQWLSAMGLTVQYFAGNFAAPIGDKAFNNEIDFDWGLSSPHGNVPAENFSVRWEGWLCPDTKDKYTLIGEVAEKDESIRLFINDRLQLEKKLNDTNVLAQSTDPVQLSDGSFFTLKLEYTEATDNAAVHLSWKTDNTSKEIIPAGNFFPLDETQKFFDLCQQLNRAALFIAGFKLETEEIGYFQKHKKDFSDLDFIALTADHWKRVNEYVRLKKAIKPGEFSLIKLFEEVDKSDPPKTIEEIAGFLANGTGWNKEFLDYLIKTQYLFKAEDFKNEIALVKLDKAISLAGRLGISARSLSEWAKANASFDELKAIAQQVKNTVKAKYEDQDWLDAAKDLNNKIRENQKKALISYLLVQQKLHDWGVKDADSLFEYFLIDVQMDACMDTSRIKQAISSGQLFVDRCLLNLEKGHVDENNKDLSVSPDAINKDRWEWMKYYRVWEANRKIFVYPENWLEPEWRDDKSPFFKDEIESYLLQNDITDGNVENAFRNYLAKLAEVASLEVCGVYQENNILHVFARTIAAPHQYFYRLNKFTTQDSTIYNQWSAWEKVPLDIRGAAGSKESKIHLIPLVSKNRLILFWAEFVEKPVNKSITNDAGEEATIEQSSKMKISDLKADKYWEIKLAWAEYRDGKWGAKNISAEFLIPGYDNIDPTDVAQTTGFSLIYKGPELFTFNVVIGEKIEVKLLEYENSSNADSIFPAGTFSIYSLQGKFQVSYDSWGFQSDRGRFPNPFETSYIPDYMKWKGNGALKFSGIPYLASVPDHTIQFSNQIFNFIASPGYPFFYEDIRRVYYVEPVKDINYRTEVMQTPAAVDYRHLLTREIYLKNNRAQLASKRINFRNV